MTAANNPDEKSENLAGSQGQDFVYDDPNGAIEQTEYEHDPNYVPEREFVLMPLFRRIGEIFGTRRRGAEQEYIYRREPDAEPVQRVAEPEPISSAPYQAAAEHEFVAPAESFVPAASEDVLGIESETMPEPLMADPFSAEREEIEPEPLIVQQAAEPQPETALAEQLESEPVVAHEPYFEQGPVVAHEPYFEPEPPAQQQFAAPEPEPEIVTQAAEEPIAISPVAPAQPEVRSLAARVAHPQPTPARPVLTQEDIKELVAPIREAAREAAARISTAVTQAAEWLQNKEEEILRRAEMSISARSAISQPEEAKTQPTEADSKLDTVESPALQRELAWRDERAAPSRAFMGQPVSAVPPSSSAQMRPKLVRKPARVPFWKRIDWSQEFTPRRVAVLGAVAMAMLMVLGISMARRPASSVLPEQQQQTRALQPGGVTLTTHPVTRTRRTVQAQSKPAAAVPAQSATSAPHRQQRAVSDEGPDVVTHYYNKPKPSPSRQATVAGGVRHYSDMQ
jgi:hypothetical protein